MNNQDVLDYISMIPLQNKDEQTIHHLLVLDYISMIPLQNYFDENNEKVFVLDYISMIPLQNTCFVKVV